MTKEELEEKTKLKEDFDNGSDEIAALDINEAFEGSTCGWGTLLYTLGTFIFCALEGAEIALLTIVGPILRCKWKLDSAALSALQVSTMSTMMITPLITSTIGDRFGRRRVSLIAAVGVTVSGALCAISQSYWQFIVLRLITGFFIGIGSGPALALSGEVTPTKFRALALSGLSLPWGIGGSVTAGIAYLILNVFGWRGLIVCTALAFSPCIMFFALIRESARFEYYRGNTREAETTIKTIYRLNGKGDVAIKLKEAPPRDEENSTISCKMVYRELRETSKISNAIIILVAGFTCIYPYYLNNYAMPRILNEGYCTGKVVSVERSCSFDSHTLFEIGVVSLSEPFSVVIMLLIIEKFGRIRPGICVGVLSVLFPSALYFCVNRAWLVSFLTLARVIIAATGLWPPILNAEICPTVIRSFMLSLQVTAQRTGGIIGIVCSEYLFNKGVRYVFVAIQSSNLIFTICMMVLRIETMGTYLT